MVEYQVIVRDMEGKTGIYSRHKNRRSAKKGADRVRHRLRTQGSWVKGKTSVFLRKGKRSR